MYTHMQTVLTVAISMSMVLFALATLADGRGLRLLRMIVNATAPHTETTIARASALLTNVKANIIATRSQFTSSSPSAPRAPSSSKVVDKAAVRNDTRKRELTHR